VRINRRNQDSGIRIRIVTIAEAGRRVVHERFCSDLIVPRHEEFYREVLERAGRSSGGAQGPPARRV
jgi:hypothetical protein